MCDSALNESHSSPRDLDAASLSFSSPAPAPTPLAPAKASNGKRKYVRKETWKTWANKRSRCSTGRFAPREPVASEPENDDPAGQGDEPSEVTVTTELQVSDTDPDLTPNNEPHSTEVSITEPAVEPSTDSPAQDPVPNSLLVVNGSLDIVLGLIPAPGLALTSPSLGLVSDAVTTSASTPLKRFRGR